MRTNELAALLCSVLLLAACSASADGAGPDRTGPASISGAITAADDGSIRVEEDPGSASGSAKAVVRITAETVIRRRGHLPATRADLTIGDTVDVWFTGPVAESYPVQAAAGVVELISPDH